MKSARLRGSGTRPRSVRKQPKVQRDRGGGSDGEAASGCDRSEHRSDESDSGEETDAMGVD